MPSPQQQYVPLLRSPHPLAELALRYKRTWHDEFFRSSAILSILALVAAFGVNLLSIQYATASVSNSVTDIVLSNIPVFEVDGLFVYGTFLLLAFTFFLVVIHPKRLPFTLFCLALFWVIRAGFTSLTHIAPFPAHTVIDFGPAITKAFFGGDLFFSGHTGTPFLFALVYWKDKGLRVLFMLWSVYFAAVVLLGHLHYSIDVAAAYFITYAIYHIAVQMFPHAYAVFHHGDPSPNTMYAR